MLRIQMIGLTLVAMLAMGVVAASSASAAEHIWLINGKLIVGVIKTQTLELFLATDHNPIGSASNEVVVHCHRYGVSIIGFHLFGLIEKLTAERLGTNDKVTCAFDKQGGCESSPAPLLLAVNLPWRTELYLNGTEVRDMVVSDGAGNPGWRVTCKAPLLGMITDECTTALTSTALANVAGGVEAIFDANTQTANCKIGTEAVRNGAGLVRGSGLAENPSAGEKLTFD